MSGIRGRDTKPEMLLRSGLFARGFRFRLHVAALPGHPDLALSKYQAVILIHGCFWHGHFCSIFKWPKTRPAFWRRKILRNRFVDRRSQRELREAGWRVLTVWECSIKGPSRIGTPRTVGMIERWLRSKKAIGTISGTGVRAT